ncbi:MAG: hypothetical protein AAGF12_22095 [Myxococcota bacterium]
MTVPLFAVSTVSLSERFHVPRVAGTGARTALLTHEDSFDLRALLVGPERRAQRAALEALAEGAMLGSLADGPVPPGLVLATDLGMRLDLYVTSLDFAMSSARQGVIEVALQLVHVPRPRRGGQLFERAMLAVPGLQSSF